MKTLCCLGFWQDPAKQEPSVAHLNLNDDKAGDASRSSGEVPKGIESTRAGYSVIFSPKQGMNARNNHLVCNQL